MPLRGLPAYAAVGVLAALTQTAFLLYFSAPLAESLHDKLATAEEEEETAYWAVPLAAALYGAAAGVIFGIVAERIEPATAALLFFIGYSALPTLKWLPTPHGVSYLEPVWWREAVYGLYLLYNMAAVLAPLIFIRRGVLRAAVAVVALAAGFFLFPGFTLPEKYASVVPELKALQGLALASWALFWAVMAVGGRLVMPIRRVQRGASP
jgi:hypothetical protein